MSVKTSDPLTKNLNRGDLATLLLLTSAPTAKSSFENGEIWYRSNASAGALHPLEFYISFPGAADLPAGLYHYDLLQPALQRLRQNPALKNFTTACNCEGRMPESWAAAPILIISALFFRSAWKYRDRAYRYLLLDCGHALENLVLALQFMEVDFEIELNFDDSTINQALHFDQQREVGLVAVRLPPPTAETAIKVPVETCDPEPELSSDELIAVKEIKYPALNEIHQSTSSPLLKKSTRENIKSIFFEGIPNWQAIPDNISQPEVFNSHIEGLSWRRSKRNFIKSKTLLSLTTFYALLGLLLEDTSTFDSIRPEILFSAVGVEGFVDG
ncbi:MAG: SagB/ThcOx family dehydrogenase, partial [Deltaproteobacteria bacterium]|nr:SagB/ThcOx family dehydrogenase [Deltaproteobacteria bacterium]